VIWQRASRGACGVNEAAIWYVISSVARVQAATAPGGGRAAMQRIISRERTAAARWRDGAAAHAGEGRMAGYSRAVGLSTGYNRRSRRRETSRGDMGDSPIGDRRRGRQIGIDARCKQHQHNSPLRRMVEWRHRRQRMAWREERNVAPYRQRSGSIMNMKNGADLCFVA